MKTGIELRAKEVEDKRQKPFQVTVDHNGRAIVFGYCTSAHGGAVLKLAQLVPWAKNPRVERRK